MHGPTAGLQRFSTSCAHRRSFVFPPLVRRAGKPKIPASRRSAFPGENPAGMAAAAKERPGPPLGRFPAAARHQFVNRSPVRCPLPSRKHLAARPERSSPALDVHAEALASWSRDLQQQSVSRSVLTPYAAQFWRFVRCFPGDRSGASGKPSAPGFRFSRRARFFR
jgi:hypothetical protein